MSYIYEFYRGGNYIPPKIFYCGDIKNFRQCDMPKEFQDSKYWHVNFLTEPNEDDECAVELWCIAEDDVIREKIYNYYYKEDLLQRV